MLITRFALALVSTGLLVCPIRSLTAQAAPVSFAKFFSDSTLWDRVVTHVVRSLSTYQVRTSVDTNPQPEPVNEFETPGGLSLRTNVLG